VYTDISPPVLDRETERYACPIYNALLAVIEHRNGRRQSSKENMLRRLKW
jgi:hypothetical protein